MNYLQTEIFNDFLCIGGACTDSCCSMEWGITIDNEAYERYMKVSGELGKRLRDNIVTYSDGMHVFLGNEGRCGMQNEDGLCSIQLELNEQGLCYTCKTFPRNILTYNKTLELRSCTLACPEVSRIVVSKKDPIQIEYFEEGYEGKLANTVLDTNEFILKVRIDILNLIQDRTVPINIRLRGIMLYLLEANKREKICKWEEFDFNFDKINDARFSHNTMLNRLLLYRIIFGDSVGKVDRLKCFMGPYEKYVLNNKISMDMWNEMNNSFMKEFTPYEYIFENIAVSYLVTAKFRTAKDDGMIRPFYELLVILSNLITTIQITWMDNNGELLDEDVMNICQKYYKTYEHNEKVKEYIWNYFMKTKVYSEDFFAGLIG